MESLSNDTISRRRGELHEQWSHRGYTKKYDPIEMDSMNDIAVYSSLPVANMPKPAQKLPVRCHSDPIPRHLNPETKAGELIEDWPRCMSCSDNSPDWQNPCKQLQPKLVTFSEQSIMHIYHPDPLYTRFKSYSKSDRKGFTSEALSEAIRIKRLVKAAQGTSFNTKDSFKYLLKNNIVSVDEILGIEHLVLGKSPKKLLKERQVHYREVMVEQRRQCRVEKMKNDFVQELAECSARSSIKSAKRARIRGAMAA
mmetsp:Transcript_5782/g.12644  ORF Transcript_5782/g.12644 Transcript_5782/m.12644 type:complete len:254 (+) Transcript_5782:277-1038(+)